MRLSTIGVVVAGLTLGGCFGSNHDLWPITSGDTLPFATADFTCYSEDEKGRLASIDEFQFTPQENADGFSYIMQNVSVADAESNQMAFFRTDADESLYMAVFSNTADEPGQNILMAWVNPGYGMSFVVPNKEHAEAVAASYGVKLTELVENGYSMKGSAENEKAFLLELARGMEKASSFMHCLVHS